MTIAKKFTLLLWVFLLPVVHVFSQCAVSNLNGNQVISTNTTWSAGTYNINGDFTVNAGVTLTIVNSNNCALTVNAANINILGTINADATGAAGGAGGGAGSSSGGAGGGSQAGGGGAGQAGGGAGGGVPGGSGGSSSGGCGIDCGNSICLNGNDADRAGGGGGGSGSGGSYGAPGGSGGNGANGRIENEPGNSRCNSTPVAGNGGAGNTAATGYGNTAINNDLAVGSGGAGAGGGGGGYAAGTFGGGGGRGGGAVNLNANADLVVSGIITASGAAGAAGGDGGVRSGAGNWNCENCGNSNGGGGNDCRDASVCGVCTYYTWGWPGGAGGGAGGGSGGGIKIQAKGNINLTGTLLANGGAGGNAGRPWQTTDGSCNNVASGGGPGAGGVIKYVYNPCANNVFAPAAAQVNGGTPGISSTGAAGTNAASAGVVLDDLSNIYVPGFSPLPAPTAGNNQLLCGPGHTPAAITATGITGGVGTYTYQWYSSTTDATGQSGHNSAPASGWVVVTNATGLVLNSVFTGVINTTTYYQLKVLSGPCTAWSNVVTVTVAPLPLLSLSAETDVLCHGGNTGSLTLTASSGTPAYTYSIDGTNYQSGAVFSGLIAGNYPLSVKDANNCSATYTSNPAVVNEPAALSITDSAVNASCVNVSNGSVTVTTVTGGISPYQYSLNGGANQNGNVFASLPQADYLVQVTDNNGCLDTMTAIVSNSYAVTANLDASTNATCFGGSTGTATVSLSGGVAPYLYSSDGTTFQTTPTLAGLTAGSYTATLKDDNGCIATVPVQIGEPTQLIVTIDSATSVPCNSAQQGSVYSTTTGGTPGNGYTYLWSSSQTTPSINGLAAGDYTITATDDNGCTAAATGTVAVISNFTTAVTTIAATCFGSTDGSAYVTINNGTGPFTYNWTGGAATDTVTGLTAGAVTVTVTDVNNCPSTSTATVTQPVAVGAQIAALQPTCAAINDGVVYVNANGGTPAYTFVWSNTSATDTITGLAAGTYSVTVQDAHACSATATTTITNPTAVTVSLEATGDSCFGQQNGSIQVDANGGTGPYTYAWSNSSTGGYVSSLAAGTYTVTTSDSHNCSVTASAVVIEPTQIQVFTSSTPDNGQGTGTATVDSVTGGSPAYFITGWSNTETVNPITALASGTYTVTVVDHNGCQQNANVVVSFVSGVAAVKNDLSFDVYPNPAKTEINIALNDISKEGTINISINDVLGHTVLTKTITTAQTKLDISSLADGTYMVELKRGDKKVVKQIVVTK